jgi:hypothetical protein
MLDFKKCFAIHNHFSSALLVNMEENICNTLVRVYNHFLTLICF